MEEHHRLTVNGDVDPVGLDCLDASGDKIADLTGEMGVLVLLGHLVLQCALDGVEASGLLDHQHQHVHIWSVDKTIQMCRNVPQPILTTGLNRFSH